MTDSVNVQTLEVRKDSWNTTRVVEESLSTSLAPNEVLIQISKFALTANNISYAGAGDMLGYWGFFPALEGWGRIPAMGWGDVIASSHPDIQIGERVWGFFPLQYPPEDTRWQRDGRSLSRRYPPPGGVCTRVCPIRPSVS